MSPVQATGGVARTILIIDDDELSREVLGLFAAEAGLQPDTAESGAQALERLSAATAAPDVVLTDLQMPGISGETLARLLRPAYPQAVLLAMSGTAAPAGMLEHFDGFLLKPFTGKDLQAAIAGVTVRPGGQEAGSAEVLNRTIYENLAHGMPKEQLHALYTLCLDDAERRLETMRAAAAARDAPAYTAAAHAIKGGCGMVGAVQLAGLAGAMEVEGLPPVGNEAPFDEFLTASERLRRMLDAPPMLSPSGTAVCSTIS